MCGFLFLSNHFIRNSCFQEQVKFCSSADSQVQQPKHRPAHLRMKSHLDEHHLWGCLLLAYTKGFCYFINKMLSLSSWIQHPHIWKQRWGSQGHYTFYRALAKPRGSDVSPSLCCHEDFCQSLPQLLEGTDLLLSPLVLLKGTSGIIIKGQFRQDFIHNVGGLFLTQIIWRMELNMTLYLNHRPGEVMTTMTTASNTDHTLFSLKPKQKKPKWLRNKHLSDLGYTQKPKLIDTVFLLSRSPATWKGQTSPCSRKLQFSFARRNGIGASCMPQFCTQTSTTIQYATVTAIKSVMPFILTVSWEQWRPVAYSVLSQQIP